MTINVHQTPAYGQYRAVVVAADGTKHEGWGISQLQAAYRAQLKAYGVPCDGCRRQIGGGEALVSRRACQGLALCAPCRADRFQLPPDHQEPDEEDGRG